jgi:hypothetical protein
MNDDIALLLGRPASPLKRVRDKREAEDLRDVVAGDKPDLMKVRRS